MKNGKSFTPKISIAFRKTMIIGFLIMIIVIPGFAAGLESGPSFENPQGAVHDIGVSDPVVPSISPAVRDLPTAVDKLGEPQELNPLKGTPVNSGADTNILDPLAANGVNDGYTPVPDFTFEGIGDLNLYTPPDTNGDVGPNHYVQMVNVKFAIFDKTGTLLTGPVDINTLWAGAGGNCQSDNSGDPIVLYDDMADRWMLTQFAVSSGQDMCIAISTTPDPTGTYYLYEFGPLPDFPDYPKFGIWPDGYYMGTNSGFPGAYYAYAFDRVSMLAGNPATYQYDGGHDNFLMPADADGQTPPPAGLPGYFYTYFKDGYVNHPPGVDRLAIYEFDVDWGTPANSTFTLVTELPIAAFNYTVCGFFGPDCIPQPPPGVGLDTVSYWPMARLQYRNFGSYEGMVGNFTVDLDGTDKAAIRWFELRKTGANPWSLYQEGTHAPDSSHHWMGSIAMDGSGNIALGYSVSDATVTKPSIRYAVHESSDPLGTMQAEASIIEGPGVNTGPFGRWGDYSAMSVDPINQCTFWFTSEYHDADESSFLWNTRVGVFTVPDCTGAIGPDFTLDVTPATQDVCIPADVFYDIEVGQVEGFTDSVTLSTMGTPAGTTTNFSTNPVTPPGSSMLTIGNTGSASAGSYNIDVIGVAPTSTHTTTVSLELLDAVPLVATLVAPADGAPDVSLTPTFEWTAASGASSYYLEVALDAGFSNVVYSATEAGTSHTAGSNLASGTLHYWRVTAQNACGDGSASSTFTFTTLVPPSIDLSKTVGTDPNVCAPTDDITVPIGTDVYYCYEVTNTGPITLSMHDLVDSELGTILDDFPFDLLPATSVWITDTTTINATTVNTATWTAFNLPYNVDDSIPYSFEDITGSGTAVALGDDEVSGAVPLGFMFNFYEADYTDIYISSNGFLTVLAGQSNGCCTGLAIPTAGDPDGLIAGWWEDLDPPEGGSIHYETLGTAPNRRLIVQFTNIQHFPSGNAVTFEYKLFEGSNLIEVHYQTAPSDGGTHSVGVENQDGSDGLQYYLGTGSLSPSLAVRYTPSTNNMASDTDTAMVTVLSPEIDVTPTSLDSTQAADMQFTYPMTISNVGTLDLDWSVLEAPNLPAVVIPASDGNFPHGSAASSYLKAPPQTDSAGDLPRAGVQGLSGVGAPAYGAEFFSDQFVTFTTDTPGSLTNIASMSGALYFGGDFINGDFSTLYAVNFNDNILYTVDTTTGSATSVGPMTPVAGGTWTGMAGDPTDGVMYASSTPDCNSNTFYTVNLATGSVTQIGTTTGFCIIDIAINAAGEMYGHDIIGDQLVAIDKNTGGITAIGSTGFDANFAQGMDFDEEADILYLAAYNNVSGTGELRIADVNTGATTLVGLIGSSTTELDAFAVATSGSTSVCNSPADLPWVSVSPTTGTTGPGLSTVLDVTFDSTGLSSGVYTGTLCVNSNDYTDPVVEVPLSLTVVGSPTYGVSLSADMAMSGLVGTTVTYNVQITNLGDVADVFDLSAAGNAWATTLSQSSISLSPGENATFTVMVDVPLGATINETDTVAITATSQGNPGVSDSTNLTTTALQYMLYLPLMNTGP